MSFSRPLQDMVATQKEKVTLECELSRPNVDVRWLKVLLSHSFMLSLPLTSGSCPPPVPDQASWFHRMVWSYGQARPWA